MTACELLLLLRYLRRPRDSCWQLARQPVDSWRETLSTSLVAQVIINFYFIHLTTHLFDYLSIHLWCINLSLVADDHKLFLFICLLIYSFTYLIINLYLFIYLFIYSYIYLYSILFIIDLLMSLSLSKFIIDLSIYLCLDPSTPEPLIVEVPCSASQQGKASNFQQNTNFQQNKGVQSVWDERQSCLTYFLRHTFLSLTSYVTSPPGYCMTYRVFRKNCVFSQFTATPPSPTSL